MRSHGNRDSLSGDLDLETFTILKRIASRRNFSINFGSG